MDIEIPDIVAQLVAQGQVHKKDLEPPSDVKIAHDRHRAITRKWRNLVGEARYDIYEDLWPYIDWSMPDWEKDFYKINLYTFVLRLPGFLPIGITYKTLAYSEWNFHKYEMWIGTSHIATSRYYELPLFMAIAAEMGNKPKKQKVIIEEIESTLTANAKTRRVSSIPTEAEMEQYHMWGGWG